MMPIADDAPASWRYSGRPSGDLIFSMINSCWIGDLTCGGTLAPTRR